MSLIIYDGRYIVADTLTVYGNENIIAKQTQKLQIKNDLVFGLVGTNSIFPYLIEWYLDGHNVDKLPMRGNETYDYYFIVIDPKQKCCHNTHDKGGYFNTYDPPIAYGVVDKYAEGILDCGKSAVEAMQMCIKKSCLLSGPIDVIDTTKPLEVVRVEI